MISRATALILAIVTALSLLWVSAAAADNPKKVALVIGNSTYTTLGKLPNPKNDADAIASTLRGMDFQVTEITDVTVQGFAKALSQFHRLANGADVALIYYSGHGLQLNSENYLIAVDATLDFDTSLNYQAIPLTAVLEATKGAATTLVYVDACRTIPTEGTFLADANERDAVLRGPAPVDLAQKNVKNTMVGFSASVGQTAEDGSGHNSPFTAAMVQYLPQQGMSVTDMFNAVTAQVVKTTDGVQKPQAFSDIAGNITLVAQQIIVVAPGASANGGQVDAPNSEERAFGDAKSVGTIGAYRAFIGRFPAGFYAELAREEITKLSGEAGAQPAEPTASSQELPVATLDPGAQCDRLAGDPADPKHTGAGVAIEDIDADGAIHSCAAAVTVNPDELRYAYEAGRALLAKGNNTAALTAMQLAAAGGYSEAMLYVAQAMIKGDQLPVDISNGTLLLQQAADAGSSTAKHLLGLDVSADLDAARSHAREMSDVSVAGGAALSGTTDNTPAYVTFLTPANRASVSIYLSGFTATGDLDLYLEDAGGKVIAKSNGVGDMPEVVNLASNEATRYYVRIQPVGSDASSKYSLSITGVGALVEPDLSFYGKYVETDGDWKIYRSADRCNMITRPTHIMPPVGWLTYRPWFYIGVTKDSDSIFTAMLTTSKVDGTDLFSNGQVQTFATDQDGKESEIPVAFRQNELRMISACSEGSPDMCIDAGAIAAFMTDDHVTIYGKAPADGAQSSVTYSLSGYSKAARRINQLCGAKADFIAPQ